MFWKKNRFCSDPNSHFEPSIKLFHVYGKMDLEKLVTMNTIWDCSAKLLTCYQPGRSKTLFFGLNPKGSKSWISRRRRRTNSQIQIWAPPNTPRDEILPQGNPRCWYEAWLLARWDSASAQLQESLELWVAHVDPTPTPWVTFLVCGHVLPYNGRLKEPICQESGPRLLTCSQLLGHVFKRFCFPGNWSHVKFNRGNMTLCKVFHTLTGSITRHTNNRRPWRSIGNSSI